MLNINRKLKKKCGEKVQATSAVCDNLAMNRGGNYYLQSESFACVWGKKVIIKNKA